MTVDMKKNGSSPVVAREISPIPGNVNPQSNFKILNENIHQEDEEKTMSFNPDTQMNEEDVENETIDHEQTMILHSDNNQDVNSFSAVDESGDVVVNGISDSIALDQTTSADPQMSGVSIENSNVSADPHQSAFAAPVAAPIPAETADSPRHSLLIKEQFKWASRTIASFKKRRAESYIFLLPVDPVALQIPTYFSVIKHPMDVSTIEKKLNTHQYTLVDQVIADFQLMFQNCFTFNGEDPVANPIVQLAMNCKNWFEKEVVKMPKTYEDALALTQKKKAGRPSDIGPRSSLPTRSTSELTEGHGKRRLAAVAASKKSGPEMKFCQYVHREAFKKSNHEFTWPFHLPVDYVGLKIPTYPQIIKHPMDLSTMKKKLDNNEYLSADDYEADFRLMLDNCFKFNDPGTDIYEMAKRFENWFINKLSEKSSFLNQHGETRPKTSQAYSEADDTDDEAYNSQMSILRQQLQLTQKMIDDLVESKRKEKERRRLASGSAYGNGTAAPAVAYQAPAPAAASFAAKSQAKPKKPSSKPRGRKKRPHASSDDERMPEDDISYEQKRELSDNINILPPDKLPQVFEIIKENANLGGVNDEEIELDIDSLEKPVLWKLYLFVKKHTRPPKKAKYDEQGAEVEVVGADASSSSEAESDDSDAAFMSGPDEGVGQNEMVAFTEKPSLGGKKPARKLRLSRSRANSGSSVQAAIPTSTTSVNQVVSTNSRKGKSTSNLSPLPFRTEKGDTTTYTSNFITSSKTTSVTASTFIATTVSKPKPTAPVKSYVSVLDLAFQIDKGKENSTKTAPESVAKPTEKVEVQYAVSPSRQPEISSNTTLEPPPRSPSPESEYVNPSEWLDLQGPADSIQTFTTQVLDGVDEIPQQITDMRASLFAKMKREAGLIGLDELVTNEIGYNLDYGNEDSEEDGALYADALLPIVKTFHPSEERRKRWEELNHILIQAEIDAAEKSEKKKLKET